MTDHTGVFRLTDMLDYQPGAVVSVTLMKRETGTVTLFAFDQGEGLSEHTTPHDALALVLEGEVGIDIQAQTFTLKAGDFVRNLRYNKNRIFAFVRALGEVDREKYAAAAGAINYGFPTIADTDIPQILPTCWVRWESRS